MAAAQEWMVLAEFARRHEHDEFAAQEVAAVLNLSDRAASSRLYVGRALTEVLTDTLTVVQLGELEPYKAQLLAETVRHLDDELAGNVQDRVLPDAPTQTMGQFRTALTRAVLAVDPEGAEQRRQQKQANRRVYALPTEDGEAVLSIHHSAATIAAMRAAIRGRAWQLKHAGDEPRTLAQLEADVAADLLTGGEEHVRVEVHLTIPMDSTEPAEVDEVGPITRQAAWELAKEATSWRWLRTDPQTGVVVDITAPSYRPPAALADFVKARDRTCRHPGCTRPARQSDVDHRVPYPKGPTSTANLDAGCRRHHRAKTHGGWRATRLPSGALQWLSPLGFRHRVDPSPVTTPTPTPAPDPDPPPPF